MGRIRPCRPPNPIYLPEDFFFPIFQCLRFVQTNIAIGSTQTLVCFLSLSNLLSSRTAAICFASAPYAAPCSATVLPPPPAPPSPAPAPRLAAAPPPLPARCRALRRCCYGLHRCAARVVRATPRCYYRLRCESFAPLGAGAGEEDRQNCKIQHF